MDLRTTIQKKWHLALTVNMAFRQPLPRQIAINGPAGAHWKEMAPGAHGDDGVPSTVALPDRDTWTCGQATQKKWPPALTEMTAFRQRWLWQTGAQPRESTHARPTPTRPVHRGKRHQ